MTSVREQERATRLYQRLAYEAIQTSMRVASEAMADSMRVADRAIEVTHTYDGHKLEWYATGPTEYGARILSWSACTPEMLAVLARVARVKTAELVREYTAKREVMVKSLEAEQALYQAIKAGEEVGS